MIAYKFLADTGVGRFSEAKWPLPEDGKPGAWLSAGGPISPCVRGIHASRVEKLPYWLDRELFQIELDGSLLETESALVAERGRLVRRVEAWNDEAWLALCAFCQQRTDETFARVAAQAPAELERARFFVNEVQTFVQMGAYATAVYVAAVGAHVASALEPEAAYRAERASQAEFLVTYLGL
jgi:hypothetical protein